VKAARVQPRIKMSDLKSWKSAGEWLKTLALPGA
jgi:hypothetical protein